MERPRWCNGIARRPVEALARVRLPYEAIESMAEGRRQKAEQTSSDSSFILHPWFSRVCGGAAIAPGCKPGASRLRRFESCRTHCSVEHVAGGRRPSCNLG